MMLLSEVTIAYMEIELSVTTGRQYILRAKLRRQHYDRLCRMLAI